MATAHVGAEVQPVRFNRLLGEKGQVQAEHTVGALGGAQHYAAGALGVVGAPPRRSPGTRPRPTEDCRQPACMSGDKGCWARGTCWGDALHPAGGLDSESTPPPISSLAALSCLLWGLGDTPSEVGPP